MEIAILAATGAISRHLIPSILKDTDNDLVLFGHNATSRLSKYQDQYGSRVSLADGDLYNEDEIEQAADGADMAILDLMVGGPASKVVVAALQKANCQRLVVTGGHCGQRAEDGANTITNSSLNSTYIYMPWIRDDSSKPGYQVIDDQQTPTTQISRAGVAEFIMTLVKDPTKYANQNVGLCEGK